MESKGDYGEHQKLFLIDLLQKEFFEKILKLLVSELLILKKILQNFKNVLKYNKI